MTSDLFIEKAFSGKPLDHCLVIDAHGHIGCEDASFPIVNPSLDRIVAAMDRMGIDLFCVSSFMSIYGDAGCGNREVEEAVAKYPGRFFGYMATDIGYPERIIPEMERSLAGGLRGVKVWSRGGRPGLGYDHPNYQPAFEFAHAHSLPVLAHTWGAELKELKPSIEKFGNINWMFAHTASLDKPAYIQFAKEYSNVYLELALSSCPRGLVEDLVSVGLVDRIIWGSDVMFLDASQQIGRVLFAQIPPEDKEKILGLNARRALRLPAAPEKNSVS